MTTLAELRERLKIDRLDDELNELASDQQYESFINRAVRQLYPHFYVLQDQSIDIVEGQSDYNLPDADHVVQVWGPNSEKITSFITVPTQDVITFPSSTVSRLAGNTVRTLAPTYLPDMVSVDDVYAGPLRSEGLLIDYGQHLTLLKRYQERIQFTKYSADVDTRAASPSELLQAADYALALFEKRVEKEAMPEIQPFREPGF